MIQGYFDQIKATADKYAATPFVLDTVLNFEIRPGNQGYVTGSIQFINGSTLHFKEFLDSAEGVLDKLMYTYHYQDQDGQLVFRYDNARHRPVLPFTDHKHVREQIISTVVPTLDEVLLEIGVSEGWL